VLGALAPANLALAGEKQTINAPFASVNHSTLSNQPNAAARALSTTSAAVGDCIVVRVLASRIEAGVRNPGLTEGGDWGGAARIGAGINLLADNG